MNALKTNRTDTIIVHSVYASTILFFLAQYREGGENGRRIQWYEATTSVDA